MCRYLGGDTTLIDEVQQIRAAQEDLAATNPTHPARVFGRAVEEQSPPGPVERAQKVRKLRNENDDMERRNVLACMQAIQDLGMEVDDALQWSCRDRLANLMRGDESGTDGQQVIHAGLFLAQKGLSAEEVKRLRSKFGSIAAKLKREQMGLDAGAALPTALKNVEGTPCKVVIYKDPEELPLLEEAFELTMQGRNSTSASSSGQRRLNFGHAA